MPSGGNRTGSEAAAPAIGTIPPGTLAALRHRAAAGRHVGSRLVVWLVVDAGEGVAVRVASFDPEPGALAGAYDSGAEVRLQRAEIFPAVLDELRDRLIERVLAGQTDCRVQRPLHSHCGVRQTRMQQSGLADLLPSLHETVYAGLSAGSMVMTPSIAEDFVDWKPPAGGDKTLD